MLIVIVALAFWSWVLLYLGAPKKYVLMMIAAVLAGIVALHLFLPLGHPVRLALGGTLRPWAIAVGIATLIYGYAQVLTVIRQRNAEDTVEEKDEGPFSEVELERYARHVVLREVGGQGQQRLKNAKVLVVGAGGLGSPVLQYLAAAGVGTLGFIDHDTVSLSNLQRQVLFTEDDLDLPKVFAAEKRLLALNPFIALRPYNRELTHEIASDLIEDYDLVLDGTDGFETRALVNRVCVAQSKPLISGAISQWEGQVTVVDSKNDTACMHCLFPKEPAPGTAPSCAEGGVLGALPGVVGSMMAVEAIKVITRTGRPLTGRMVIYDALYGETRIIETAKRDDCEVCA